MKLMEYGESRDYSKPVICLNFSYAFHHFELLANKTMSNIEITTTYEGIIPVSEILQEAKENRERVAHNLYKPMIKKWEPSADGKRRPRGKYILKSR